MWVMKTFEREVCDLHVFVSFQITSYKYLHNLLFVSINLIMVSEIYRNEHEKLL